MYVCTDRDRRFCQNLWWSSYMVLYYRIDLTKRWLTTSWFLSFHFTERGQTCPPVVCLPRSWFQKIFRKRRWRVLKTTVLLKKPTIKMSVVPCRQMWEPNRSLITSTGSGVRVCLGWEVRQKSNYEVLVPNCVSGCLFPFDLSGRSERWRVARREVYLPRKLTPKTVFLLYSPCLLYEKWRLRDEDTCLEVDSVTNWGLTSVTN